MKRNQDGIAYLVLQTLEAYKHSYCDLQTCKDVLNKLLRMHTDELIDGIDGRNHYGYTYSKNAAAAIKLKEKQRLVRDHAVPIDAIVNLLIAKNEPSVPCIQSKETISMRIELESYLRVVVVTKAEDNLLTRSGLKSIMPEGWPEEGSPYARYREVGIEIEQTVSESQWALERIRKVARASAGSIISRAEK